jgi:hypothetical protein
VLMFPQMRVLPRSTERINRKERRCGKSLASTISERVCCRPASVRRATDVLLTADGLSLFGLKHELHSD